MKMMRKIVPAVLLVLGVAAYGEEKLPEAKALGLIFGGRSPEILATDLEGKGVTLESLKGKPVVLQFGSATEPVFRKHAGDSEKLAKDYAGKAAVVVVYQRESHAADGASPLEINQTDGYHFASPATQEERVQLAKQTAERLGIKNQTVLVDAFNDTTAKRYGARPNATYVIDAKGNLAAAYPWVDVKKIRGALDAVIAGKDVPAEFQGPVRADRIPAATFEAADGNGRQSVAIALDSLTLDEKQRQAIYVPIASLLADLREFRETRGTATQPANDLAEWQAKIKAGYDKAMAAVKENVGEKEGKALMEAIERVVPARLRGGR